MSQQYPPLEPSRRSSTASLPDTRTAAPFLTWDAFIAWLAEPDEQGRPRFQQGDHVGIIGPTGTGKTHIAFELAELRAYVIAVACKPQDPLTEDALRRGYWPVPGRQLEIPIVDGRPLHNRVLFWPRLSDAEIRKTPQHELLALEKRIQKPAVGGAIGYVRVHGNWCLLLDEGTWICRDLNLQRDVDAALTGFRTLKASVIILGQRPAWMGRYVLAMPVHLVLFQTSDADDLKALGDISGLDTKLIQHLVRNLDHDRHEALYINTRTRQMFRTIARPR